MSIKDLFDKGQSLKFVKNKTKDDLSENVESYRYIEAYSEKRARFIPDVDFATASNFARFGSANASVIYCSRMMLITSSRIILLISDFFIVIPLSGLFNINMWLPELKGG